MTEVRHAFGKYELKTARRQGHWAEVGVEVSASGFGDRELRELEDDLDLSALDDLNPHLRHLGEKAIWHGFYYWHELGLSYALDLSIDQIIIKWQGVHSSDADIQVTVAVALLDALFTLAEQTGTLSAAEAAALRERVSVKVDYGGRAVVDIDD